MTLPDYWWLLTVAVIGQGVFFILAGTLRRRKKALQDAPRTVAVFVAALACGMGYAVVQHDPVLLVAQVFLAVVIYRIWRKG